MFVQHKIFDKKSVELSSFQRGISVGLQFVICVLFSFVISTVNCNTYFFYSGAWAAGVWTMVFPRFMEGGVTGALVTLTVATHVAEVYSSG